MNLTDLEKNWDAFGKVDPLWACLPLPEKRNRAWIATDFFRTGIDEIAQVLSYAAATGNLARHHRALDFGCGVGRLTQALCRMYDYCEGVDLAASMIQQAETHNQYGSRCCYHWNRANDLRRFEDGRFGLIYSSYALQHMRSEYSKNYVRELVRTLAPGGLLIFQMPSGRVAGATEPLPEAAYKARTAAPQQLFYAQAGAPLTVPVSIQNLSAIPWPAAGDLDDRYCVRVGNHWRNERGELLQKDDGRAALPYDVEPMEEVRVPLTVTAPHEPGRYILEITLVQEGVSWFSGKDYRTAWIPVQVNALGNGRPSGWEGENIRGLWGSAGALLPQMEMYAVPPEMVRRWIPESGGKLIDVVDLFSPVRGAVFKDWQSYCYCVTK